MNNKSLDQLKKDIIKFQVERGWKPKNTDLAKSVVIEAAEILEKYQWESSNKKINLEEVGEVVADDFIYLVEFCDSVHLDINSVVKDKIIKNGIKYPAEKFKGKNSDKFYYEQK